VTPQRLLNPHCLDPGFCRPLIESPQLTSPQSLQRSERTIRALATAFGGAFLEFGIGFGHTSLRALFKQGFIAIVFHTGAAARAEDIYFAGTFAGATHSIIKAVE